MTVPAVDATEDPDPLLTVPEVRAWLRLPSEWSTYAALKRMETVRLGSRRGIRVRRSEVERFITERTVPPATERPVPPPTERPVPPPTDSGRPSPEGTPAH